MQSCASRMVVKENSDGKNNNKPTAIITTTIEL